LTDTKPTLPYLNFRAVQHTPGHLRKPPNVYDSTVYGSSPGAIRLTPSQRPRASSRVDVPGLPGAFMVMDVFTPEECLQIAQAAEAIGFEKDEAAGGSATAKASVCHCQPPWTKNLTARSSLGTLFGLPIVKFWTTSIPRFYPMSHRMHPRRQMAMEEVV
jgi:hypothetical protein